MAREHQGATPADLGLQPDNVEQQDVLEGAAKEAESYWQGRLNDDIAKSDNPEVSVAGNDFDIARCHAYLERIAAGDYFNPVEITGTYDGQERHAQERSVFAFFKGALAKYEHMAGQEASGSADYEQRAAQVKTILAGIETIKPQEAA